VQCNTPFQKVVQHCYCPSLSHTFYNRLPQAENVASILKQTKNFVKLISRKKIQIVVKLACFFAGIKPPNTYDIVQKSTTYSSKIFTVSHRCCITRLRPLHTPFGCARSMRHLGARATRALSARSQIFWLACIAAKRALAPAVPSFWARSRSLVLRVWSARACWP